MGGQQRLGYKEHARVASDENNPDAFANFEVNGKRLQVRACSFWNCDAGFNGLLVCADIWLGFFGRNSVVFG